MALLSPRLWLALALAGLLAFSHFAAYRSGKNHVRLEWTASVARANEEARRMETLRQRNVDDAAKAASTRAARLAADAAGARRESRGLRDDLDATRRYAAQSSAAADNAVRTLSELLGSCTDAYLDVAGEADRAYSEVKTLRDAWPK